MAYTPQQIKQFITDKGIQDNPYAIKNFADQYGVSPDQVDTALGAQSGQSASWLQQAGLSGPRNNAQQYSDRSYQNIVNGRGLSTDDPHKAFALSQQYGLDPMKLGQAMGSTPEQTQAWMQQQGFGGQQPPTMPGAGGPPPSTPQAGGQQQNPYMPMSSPTQTPGNTQPGQQNPYMQQIGQDITRQVTNNLQRNILPGIGRGAVAAGGYGGSRQGIAEGLAIGETNNNLAGQLANLYGGQFNTDRNYGLQSDALDLNVYNSNQNWMNQGQQNQLNTIDRILGWNQGAYNTATGVQNTPLNYYSQFANIGQGLGGMGSQNTQNMPGNPYLGALAGYQFGSQMAGG